MKMMKKDDFQRSRHDKCSFLVICLLIFSVIFIYQDQIDAQTVGSVITYEDSIVFDEEEGNLLYPSFVSLNQKGEELYVIDGKSRVIIYTTDFFPLNTLSKKNGVHTPQGLAVDEDGNLYIAQTSTNDNPRHRISVFRTCLKLDKEIYLEGFEGADEFVPYRIAVDKKGNIYVAASYYPGVVLFDADGSLVGKLSPDEEGRKVNINDVNIDKSGRIYLVSEEEGRIYVYDENRKFIFKFGEKGGSSGKLSRPKAISIDNNNGRMYVVDYMRHAVSVYDKEGKYLFEFGGLGWGEGWFQFPMDIAVDDLGRIFVADLFNQRVQVFNSW